MRRFLLVMSVLQVCCSKSPPGSLQDASPQTQFIRSPFGAEFTQDPATFPILLQIVPSAALWEGAIETAVNTWEQNIGYPLFLLQGVLENSCEAHAQVGAIVIILDPSLGCIGETDCRARTFSSANNRTGRIVATVIALPPIDELEHNVAAKIVEHELGHALGLAHDQHDRYSLMYPSYQGDWQKLTKQDREVVRAKYKVSFVE